MFDRFPMRMDCRGVQPVCDGPANKRDESKFSRLRFNWPRPAEHLPNARLCVDQSPENRTRFGVTTGTGLFLPLNRETASCHSGCRNMAGLPSGSARASGARGRKTSHREKENASPLRASEDCGFLSPFAFFKQPPARGLGVSFLSLFLFPSPSMPSPSHSA